MKYWRIVFVGALIAASASVRGQDDLSKPWELSLRAGATATDNRDGLSDNKENNVDLFIEPRADLKWRDGTRSALDLFLAPQVKWHSNPRSNSEGGAQNETEIFGTAGIDVNHSFTPRVSGKIGDAFTYTDDPKVSENGVTVRQSANHYVNNAHAGLSAYLLPTVVGEASVATTSKRYEDSVVAADEDEDIHDGRVTLGYIMGSGIRLYGLGGYSVFDNRSTERDRGSSIVTGDLGVEKKFSPDFTASVAAGYQTAEYKDSELDGKDTANARGEINLRGASDTRFRIAALYGFASPNVRPYSLQKSTSFLGSVEHDLIPRRLTMDLHGQYTEGEYSAEAADLAGGTDCMTSVGVGAVYRINRNLSVNASYNFESWNSDLREDFDRSVVDVGVQARL